MTSQHTDNEKVVRYYIRVLLAMTTMMAGVIVACLIGLWRTIPCSESDMKYKIIGCGVLGTIGYLAVVVNLFRLQRQAGLPDYAGAPKPQ